MRNFIIPFSFVITIFSCTATAHTTQIKPQTYEVSREKDGTKILKGLLTRADIENDSSYKWFHQNYNLGQANSSAVTAFQQKVSQFQMVVFFGTWCEDSQNLLPVFYRLVDKSNFPASNITLIGVDRDKTTLDELHKAFNIINVPTFIVMKDGKEVGRVVEYGKYGQIDKELGEIVSTIQ